MNINIITIILTTLVAIYSCDSVKNNINGKFKRKSELSIPLLIALIALLQIFSIYNKSIIDSKNNDEFSKLMDNNNSLKEKIEKQSIDITALTKAIENLIEKVKQDNPLAFQEKFKPPTAIISSSNVSGKTPLTVSFDGASSGINDSPIVSYSWSFGDGTTAAGSAVSHTYTTPGDYYTELTVIDTSGNIYIETTPVIVGNDDKKKIEREDKQE